MRQLVKVLGKTQIPYFVKGGSPTLLIHAGTHGDEYGVIESVRKAVEKYEERLPDFVYVPVVSPSAVAKRTRVNGDGIDLNRNFFEDSSIAEVEANFAIARGKNIDTVATFHEDPEPGSRFYLYDVGVGLGENESWKKFCNDLESMGVGLLNGVDDPNDPELNYTFTDGYHFWPVLENGYPGGSFNEWATRNGIPKALLPEVPGHLTQDKKNEIVDLFFRYFLLKT